MTWGLWDYRTPDGAFDYAGYVAAQVERNANSLLRPWVHRRTMAALAQYILARIPHPTFGLCHGTRTGEEQRWFREDLPGCEVWGTEIAPTADQYPHTLRWDYHEVRPDWVGACDFVYSNALDHSYDPERAVRAWMSCVTPEGMCLIDWLCVSQAGGSASDPFSAQLPSVAAFLDRIGNGAFGIVDIFQTPFDIRGRKRVVFRGQKGTRHRVATIVLQPGQHPSFAVPPEWATGPLPRLRSQRGHQ